MGDPAGPVTALVSILKNYCHLWPLQELQSIVVKHKSKATSFPKSHSYLCCKENKSYPTVFTLSPYHMLCTLLARHYSSESPWQQEVRVSQSLGCWLLKKAGTHPPVSTGGSFVILFIPYLTPYSWGCLECLRRFCIQISSIMIGVLIAAPIKAFPGLHVNGPTWPRLMVLKVWQSLRSFWGSMSQNNFYKNTKSSFAFLLSFFH